ncbi:MAG: PASTA domain-containing protein [Prevotella sp.]|nr:PASTA domain-containing protein [Prevotella sp.]
MKSGEFFRKIFSLHLWANLLAMALVVVLLCFGVKYGIDFYTHHGEKIIVPDVKHKSFRDAEHILDDLDLEIQVSDTGYVKTLPPDCVLEQSPEPGAVVKSGRIIYVIINSPSTPKLTIPDVIDNSSLREARAKLIAMGFKVIDPEYVPGERDWVYGIKVRGRNVVTGDRVSIEDPLILQVGDGKRDLMDSVSYIDPVYPEFEKEEDEFEEVLELETNADGPSSQEQPAQTQQPEQPEQPAQQAPAAPAQPAQPAPSTP